MVKIIGISGKKGSGKDTVAQFIVNRLNHMHHSSVVIGFAFALKKELAQACNVTVDEIEQKKPFFRLLLQAWGTDFRRNLYGTDYWLKQMDTVIKECNILKVQYLIIPDVRFKNELDFVLERGGFAARVNRPELQSTDRHISELELDNAYGWDWVIDNSGTLQDLENKVQQIKLP